MIANLSQALALANIDLDVLLIKARGPHVAALPSAATVIKLKSRHTATSVWEVARYLRSARPDALLAVKHRAILAALRARSLARADTPISGRLGTTVSAALANKSERRKRHWYRAMKKYYPRLHRLIAVSQGVANDVISITGMPQSQVPVVRNPTISPELLTAAQEHISHPWLENPATPVILGVGRLTEQKDFATMLSAFARVTKVRPARLIILGEGNLRDALEAQAVALGVSESVVLPGFQANPWAWMRHATLFVLSSRWEGSPNTLTEAMALGVPVVSTDCPSGPTELLDGGKIAPLVPMGDPEALSQAILAVLAEPPDPRTLIQAVAPYHRDVSATAYLRVMALSHS
jgi:glycosyltransferase involved in cell wall biosynthesis